MEINHRQQNKFSSQESALWIECVDGTRRDIDYVEIEKALKDFCFIRRELSNYSYIYASQLQFDIHLTLPYWEYLFVHGTINKCDRDELEEGSLLTIYIFFKEIYEAEGHCYLYKHNLFGIIAETINTYRPDSIKKEIMVDKIKFLQKHYSTLEPGGINPAQPDPNEESLNKNLVENDNWVYLEFVEKYYIDIADSFKSRR